MIRMLCAVSMLALAACGGGEPATPKAVTWEVSEFIGPSPFHGLHAVPYTPLTLPTILPVLLSLFAHATQLAPQYLASEQTLAKPLTAKTVFALQTNTSRTL